MPVIMLLVNDNWLFTKTGYLDPWYNVGYFLYYDDPGFRSEYYKIARASWLIPGYFLYQVFGPLAANYILHAGSLILMTVFTYLTLTRMVSRDISFITSVFLTVYIPVHGSGGWDYQTTPSGTYFALTAYLTCLAGQSDAPITTVKWWVFTVAAGAAFAATFHANILFVNLLPIIFGFYYVNSQNKIFSRKSLYAVSGFTVGFIALSILLGIINVAIGRKFLYFMPLFEIVFNYVRDTNNEATWWIPLSLEFFRRPEIAGYLIFPMVVLVIAVITAIYIGVLNRRVNFDKNRAIIFLICQHVYLGACWIIWHQIGHVALAPDYFAYPIQLSAVFCLAGLLAFIPSGNSNVAPDKSIYLLPLLVLLILTLPWNTGWLFGNTGIDGVLLGYGAMLFTIGLILVLNIFNILNSLLKVSIIFIIVFIQVSTLLPLPYQSDYVLSANPDCSSRRDTFLSFMKIESSIRRYIPASETAYILWQPNLVLKAENGCSLRIQEFAMSLTSISSHYFSQSMIPPDSFSSVEPIPEEFFLNHNPQTLVVILTADENYAKGIETRFHKAGHAEINIREINALESGQHRFFSYVLYTKNADI